MNVRKRYILFQLIIIAAFLATLSYILFLFYQGYTLKKLELRMADSVRRITGLELLTEQFPYGGSTLDDLWDEWNTVYTSVDEDLTAVLRDPAHKIFGDRSVNFQEFQLESWENIKSEEITNIRTLITGSLDDLRSVIGTRGIHLAKEVYEAKGDPSFANTTAQLTKLENDLTSLKSRIASSVSIPITNYLVTLKVEVKEYTTSLYTLALVNALVLLIISIVLALVISFYFGRNVATLKKGLDHVLDGNFDVTMNLKTGDEFQDISDHFSFLSRNLWRRLDSMKDMMRDIVGDVMREDANITKRNELILRLVAESTGADGGILMRIENDELIMSTSRGFFPPPMPVLASVSKQSKEKIQEWFDSRRLKPGEGILGRVSAGGIPRFIRSNTRGELPENDIHDSKLYIHSAMFSPLIVAGRVLGIIALAKTKEGDEFSDLDYSYVRAYSEFVALTMDNIITYQEIISKQQIGREVEIAADIQKKLLPTDLPTTAGLDIAGFSVAARGVSGDYYDVFELSDKKTAIVICDVAGKGVPASLLMVMIRTALRVISNPEKSAGAILTALNRTISGRLGLDRFATISLIIHDSATNVITYSNGAHYPLFILRGETNQLKKFDTDDLPMGVDINARFESRKIRVSSHDLIFLFTDGLPEARNPRGQALGTSRLFRFLASNAHETPGNIVENVKGFLEDFTADAARHDDQTFLAMKIL